MARTMDATLLAQCLDVLLAQHQAIDVLAVQLMQRDDTFRLTQSVHVWPAVTRGHQLMEVLRHRLKER